MPLLFASRSIAVASPPLIGALEEKQVETDLSPKCPKCGSRVDQKADALSKEEWPMPEWPIYLCSSCGVLLE